MTKSEIYLAAINGDYTGNLPKPNTKIECYLYQMVTEGVVGGGAEGKWIKSAEQTTVSTAAGGKNIFTFTFSDDTTQTFTVQNGRNGSAPYIGSNGNWYTDYDTGVPATPSKQSVKIKKYPRGSSQIMVESVGDLNDLQTRQIFAYGGKYLCAGQTFIDIYGSLPMDNDDENYDDVSGSIDYSGFQAKKVCFILDTREPDQRALIYVLSTEGRLYYAQVNEDDIEDGYYMNIEFMPIGSISETIDDFCVCENRVYFLNQSRLATLPGFNGDPMNVTHIDFPDASTAESLCSDGHYLYFNNSASTYSICIPPTNDYQTVVSTSPIVYHGDTNEVSKICYWDNKFFAINLDYGNVVWAKNDMLQPFDLEHMESSDYIDGMFKPIPSNVPDIYEPNMAHITCSKNYLLIFNRGEIYIYKNDPFFLLGIGNFGLNETTKILQVFEGNTYLYIITNMGCYGIKFVTESKQLQVALS